MFRRLLVTCGSSFSCSVVAELTWFGDRVGVKGGFDCGGGAAGGPGMWRLWVTHGAPGVFGPA